MALVINDGACHMALVITDAARHRQADERARDEAERLRHELIGVQVLVVITNSDTCHH
jgi:hypothetical protein